jgi:1,4-alpha-glucan branching enzyme
VTGHLDDGAIRALVEGRHGDPFAVLGPHVVDGATVVRAFVPHAERLIVVALHGNRTAGELTRRDPAGVFEGVVEMPPFVRYRLEAANAGGTWSFVDPYQFGPVAVDEPPSVAVPGVALYDRLGAWPATIDGVAGVAFAVHAPHASRVAVVGDMNGWNPAAHPLRKLKKSGIWEIFLPGVAPGARYKYLIDGPDGARLPLKADPFGRMAQIRPETASVVAPILAHAWSDGAWMTARAGANPPREPLSILEVHAASWRRGEGNAFLDWDQLATELIPYAMDLGFTHLEVLPISEHPLDASWGYQPLGLFAPTARHGAPDGFARFVDAAHAAGLGVILDWVPAHFPTDAHGLALFDGTALYEHPDPRRGFHPDWNTAIYDLGKAEVRAFLIANALYWLELFHVDGLRVDAVASMLYLDYSRAAGEWLPNARGGRENEDAVRFFHELRAAIDARGDGALLIAEESTAWPKVSRPPAEGGLGFHFKWNMGWMNDTLRYAGRDPVHRRFHHGELTFGPMYAFSEAFVLPVSHDEVVHGKGTLLGRMPGDAWRKFAGVRAYLAFLWGHPGKKLLFMGQEFAHGIEWRFDEGLEWHLLGQPAHRGVQTLVRDLNRLHRELPALHARDCEPEGFRWIVVDDAAQSVVAFARFGSAGDAPVVVIVNFTPEPRVDYRLGLPAPGRWREILNTDAEVYGGAGLGNAGLVVADGGPSHGFPASAAVTIPPLASLMLTYEADLADAA